MRKLLYLLPFIYNISLILSFSGFFMSWINVKWAADDSAARSCLDILLKSCQNKKTFSPDK
jgi:hypothetical protein